VAVRWNTGGLGEVPVEERPVVFMLLRQSSSPMSSNTTTSPPAASGGLTRAARWCLTTDLTSVENTVSVTSRCWELSPRLFLTSLAHLEQKVYCTSECNPLSLICNAGSQRLHNSHHTDLCDLHGSKEYSSSNTLHLFNTCEGKSVCKMNKSTPSKQSLPCILLLVLKQ
jgi:hypothetical protein